MLERKKLILILSFSIVAVLGIYFSYVWYKSRHAIQYAISPYAVIAITGNDYETTLNKLHNLPLVQELENDGNFELLQPNDFLKLEVAHSPALKKLFKNKALILSFKAGAKNQLQSLLSIEGSKEKYDSLIHEIIGDDYVISKYSSPSGEILEAYNTQKQKELVMSYAAGLIIITNEALYAEETLKSIKKHQSLFKRATLNFTSNYIYVKQSAMQKWVDNLTKNNTSEFYQWLVSIDECELKLNDEGTLAKANFYFYKESNAPKIQNESTPFLLENWLQNITTNFIAYHPERRNSEIKLSEVYRCYSNLQDEKINNNTYIIAHSEMDSTDLISIFSKHSLEQLDGEGSHRIYKFGKYPFFKTFCNSTTPDLPETFISLISNHDFVVGSSVSSLIPILQKIDMNRLETSSSSSCLFLIQMQPQTLLPYFSNIIKDEYKDHMIQGSFLQNLDFVQYRLASFSGDKGTGTIYFTKSASLSTNSSELLWSKTVEQETAEITVLKGAHVGDNYILFQDAKNILHCFDFSSREIWQKFILGNIQSKIFPVDLYRDKQNQFFFNTANQIYAIDNKGNDIINFPKQLYNEGIHGLYLFDMGDTYEYFLAKNHTIFAFDAGGAALDDWRPKESPVTIDDDLLHFKKRNKNYIIGINHTGEIVIWNRFGKMVEKDIDFMRPLSSKFVITTSINKKYRNELISVDTSGNILSVTLDSLKKGNYKYTLDSKGSQHYIIQSGDSTFQKILYQNDEKLLLFDRFLQTTDTLAIERNFKLQNVFDVDGKNSFIVVSNGFKSKIISSRKKIVASNIEGDIIAIVADEIPNQFFVVTFDQLKRVNLYKISL